MIDAHLLEAIGDAPEHIAALRKLAVAFAIGGHLEDSSTDATQLLASLEAVKDTLRKQCQIGKKRSAWTVLPEHLPEVFNDPTKFVPLGEIARIEKGKTGIKQAVPGPYPLVVTAATRETCDHFDYEGSAAIIPLVSSTGHGKASINRLHYQEGQFALGTILAAVFPHDPDSTSARFLFEYLSAYKDELLVSRMTGTANVTLSIGRIAEVPVPLLSRNAQAKVDELMALCDRLEEARKTREELRDELTAASLARLTAPDTTAEDFPTHAAFALEALPSLTTRPDQIKTLRQTILNLAVRGKLVEQDAADEPVSELLKRIASDKKERTVSARDRHAGAIKSLSRTGLPFDLPSSWHWVAFGEITISRDGERIPVSKAERENRAKNYDYYGASGVIDKIDGYLFDKPLLLIGEDGANLINRSTPIAFIARGKYWVNNHAHVLDGLNEQFLRYVELFINATDLKPFVTGTAQPKMNQAKMNSIPVAVPPLAEQSRIVAKVDALMALCDRLEAALTTTDTTRTRLLEALLHEALEPATVNLKAAE